MVPEGEEPRRRFPGSLRLRASQEATGKAHGGSAPEGLAGRAVAAAPGPRWLSEGRRPPFSRAGSALGCGLVPGQ